jgi:hypothetical protein
MGVGSISVASTAACFACAQNLTDFHGWATLSIWLYTQPLAWEICKKTLGRFRGRLLHVILWTAIVVIPLLLFIFMFIRFFFRYLLNI